MVDAVSRLVRLDLRLGDVWHPEYQDTDYERMVRLKNPPDYLCANIPSLWPVWLGGQYSFLEQGQPFNKMEDLRLATMLEF